MNSLVLNSAAISVAILTFAVLLGPLLHIPPALPALTVFGLLGVTTIDQVSFQGQGTNVFLDWCAQRSPEYRQRVVHHEAGHFLAAHLLGIPIQGYSLTAWEALRKGFQAQAGVAFAEPALDEISPTLLERYGTIWMAGIAAEVMVYGQATGGEEDRQKLQFVMQGLGRDGQQQQRLALLRAENLLKTHQASYAALVTAMERRASLEECLALLSPSSESSIPVTQI